MQRLIYSIQFHSFWQVGSGLSGGSSTNALVLKDNNSLPFIPGRTLKGLLREGAEEMSAASFIPDGFTKKVFGISTEGDAIKPASHYEDFYGCFFGNAELSANLKTALSNGGKSADTTGYLYQHIASTAIDSEGQAEDSSLRRMEVTIPITLYAYIDDFPDDPVYTEAMKRCFQWVKRMGVNRNRGLGRCSFQLKTNEQDG